METYHHSDFRWNPIFGGERDPPGSIIFLKIDALMFMKRARNFTFTTIDESDGIWGVCVEENNCTGMLGMVNRGEVDLALGKFNFQALVQANLCCIL